MIHSLTDFDSPSNCLGFRNTEVCILIVPLEVDVTTGDETTLVTVGLELDVAAVVTVAGLEVEEFDAVSSTKTLYIGGASESPVDRNQTKKS